MIRFALALIFATLASGCNAAPQAPVSSAQTERVELPAADGVKVIGNYVRAANPKALILLFHQAGSSKAEYDTIAPRLAANGYSSLAIDQRSGGGLFGPNETAKALKREAGYLDAKPDLEAALAWAGNKQLPVVLWGSSYSSALVFLVAADHPGKIAALLAFSPGEYLGKPDLVSASAARLTIPVFITTAKDNGEIAAAQEIASALRTRNQQFIPKLGGVHGSSTLIALRNRKGVEENWAAVLSFLKSVFP